MPVFRFFLISTGLSLEALLKTSDDTQDLIRLLCDKGKAAFGCGEIAIAETTLTRAS